MYTENGKLAEAISNHTKILKLLLDSSSHDYRALSGQVEAEREIARQLQNGLNEDTRNIFVNKKLLIATLLMDELSEDIDITINAINEGRHVLRHGRLECQTRDGRSLFREGRHSKRVPILATGTETSLIC